MRALYYILVDIDLHPYLANAPDGVLKIAITADNCRKNAPIIYIEGKGKADNACSLSLENVYKYSFLKYFEEQKITWILDFIRDIPNFTEKELTQEIVSHGLALVTQEY